MCEVAEKLVQEGVQKGIQKGIQKGRAQERTELLLSMFQAGEISLETAAFRAGMTGGEFQQIVNSNKLGDEDPEQGIEI